MDHDPGPASLQVTAVELLGWLGADLQSYTIRREGLNGGSSSLLDWVLVPRDQELTSQSHSVLRPGAGPLG